MPREGNSGSNLELTWTLSVHFVTVDCDNMLQIDAFDQRSTRMKEESKKFEEEIKGLSKRNCELQAEVLDLHKKYVGPAIILPQMFVCVSHG